MDKRVWFFGLLAVAVMDSIGAQEQVYVEDGGKLILKPISDSNPLTSILWKIGPDMVAEWVKAFGTPDYYGQFAGRTSLNDVTGQLEINTVTSSDSGVYSVELNGKVQSKTYIVKMIKKVSKPTVSLKPLTCSSDSDFCTLSCDGGISEAEPITYSWRRDGGDWIQSVDNLMHISKDDKDVESFSCQMENPLGVEESKPINNPFYQTDSPGGMIGGIIGGLILLIAVICGVYCYRNHESIRERIPLFANRNNNKENHVESQESQNPQQPADNGETIPLNQPENHVESQESQKPEQPAGDKTSGSAIDVGNNEGSQQ